MNIEEGIRQSFEVIGGNKLRSALTMLGVVFGVGCIIAVSIVGLGFRGSISGELGKFGSTLMWIQPDWRAYSNTERRIPLDDRDVNFFRSDLPGLVYSGTMYTSSMSVAYLGETVAVDVFAVGPDHLTVFANGIAEGRSFVQQDVDTRSRVCILRPDIAERLFDDADPLGRQIRIGTDMYTVIGVTERVENAMVSDGSGNQTVFVPSSIFRRRFFGSGPANYWVYFLQFDDADSLATAEERIDAYLINRYGYLRGERRFRIDKLESFISTVNTVLDTVTLLVSVIAAISLVVGGLGIMNIMLVTVTERTKEIGVRMAIGARRRDILAQFLIEAVALCLIGGFLGTGFGAGLAAIACLILKWQFSISAGTILLAVGISCAIGLGFGTYPAHKASRLTPIEALRVDV
jgi:putative ABC transport system permease protein